MGAGRPCSAYDARAPRCPCPTGLAAHGARAVGYGGLDLGANLELVDPHAERGHRVGNGTHRAAGNGFWKFVSLDGWRGRVLSVAACSLGTQIRIRSFD